MFENFFSRYEYSTNLSISAKVMPAAAAAWMECPKHHITCVSLQACTSCCRHWQWGRGDVYTQRVACCLVVFMHYLIAVLKVCFSDSDYETYKLHLLPCGLSVELM